MKKIIVLILALFMIVCLCACEKNNDSSKPDDGAIEETVEEQNEIEELKIKEYGFYQSTQTFYNIDEGPENLRSIVYLAVGFENINDNYASTFAQLTIAGYDSDGKIVFSAQPVMPSRISPNETIYVATIEDVLITQTIDRIECRITTPAYGWEEADPNEHINDFTVQNINTSPEPLNDFSVLGEYIANTDAAHEYAFPIISVVFRDADGNICGGSGAIGESSIVKGETMSFRAISCDADIPYSTIEGYACQY